MEEWTERAKTHQALVSPIADGFLQRRGQGQKHPVYDFLFTYYNFSPTKLKQWVPSFEETLGVEEKGALPCFSDYWFEVHNSTLRLNSQRLKDQTLTLTAFIEELCNAILKRTPRFGCFGLHEWAMVYRLSREELRHTDYRLRLSPEEIVHFVESQNLCCTHYDAYRFFTPQAAPLNMFKPSLQDRLQNEQAGCLHANMDIYKWTTKLWPWIGSDFIAKAFLIALEGRELDMRASPYDLQEQGYAPIRIETECGRKEYQQLQQQYSLKTLGLRQELAAFCGRLRAWQRPSSLPWYKDGLRFKCTECGKCCTGTPGFVWVSQEEICSMAQFLNISVDLFKRKYIRSRDNRYALIEKKIANEDYECIFLKDKKCQIYKARPTQCRTFPWWKENLNTEESWKLAAKECEGINNDAPIVPYSQIEQSIKINDVQA